MKRVGLQALFATVILLASLAPATAARATASEEAFRPVKLDRSGSVLVRSIAANPVSRSRVAKPFLRTPSTGAARGAQRGALAPVATVLAAATATGSAEEVLTSFPVMSLDQQVVQFGTGQFVTPPDNGLAAGPSNVVEMVNSTGSIWAKSGGSALKVFDLNTFFAVPAGYSFSDPRVLYDGDSQRWFASGVAFVQPSLGSVVTIAVSATSDPTGTWFQYSADNSANVTHDQPKIGVSSDKVVLSWNDFLSGQFFQGQSTWVFQKSQMLTGTPANGAAIGPDSTRNGLVPAVQLTSNAAEYVVYNRGGSVGVVTITGTPLQGNVAWNEVDPVIPATSTPPTADQPGMPGSIDTNDDRFLTAVWENGVLWTGGNDACLPPNDTAARPCSRLIQVFTSGGTVNQDFDIGSTGAGLYFPAFALDSGGDMYVVYNISSSTQDVGVRIVGQLAGAAPQTLALAQAIRAGDATYDMNPCFGTTGASRWGDYAGAAIDPQNPSDVWVASEFAAVGTLTSPSDTGCAWATFAARLTFSAPAVSGISPTSEQSTPPTTVTVSGTDFTTASSVSIGGVAATAVTVSAPNQLTATAPSGCGTVDVIVTTADGTSATSAADRFTYLTACSGAPVLGSIAPTSGPTGGGTLVTFSGSGFVPGATAFGFGSNPATGTSCSSSTACTAISPPGFGTVTVTASVNGQAATGSATFAYIPSLSSISPSSGPTAGGTLVTITGSGFDSAPGSTQFFFAGKPATNVACSSSTSCLATTPSGKRGSATVTATVDGQASPTHLTFTYRH
jgi:IPT/TIG domain